MWAGRVQLRGQRKYPFVGTVDIRSDTFVLATVRTIDGERQLEQRVCDVDIAKAAGGEVTFKPSAYPAMPLASLRFIPQQDGSYHAPPWRSGWGSADLDHDGQPGIAVQVSVPLCGGTLHMSSYVDSEATARPYRGGLLGTIHSRLNQQTLAADGICLSIVSKDHIDSQTGTFVYLPVPANSTCATVPRSAWPDPSTLR